MSLTNRYAKFGGAVLVAVSMGACAPTAVPSAAVPPTAASPAACEGAACSRGGRTSSMFGESRIGEQRIGEQSQALTVVDVYDLRFVNSDQAPLSLMDGEHRLSIAREEGELVVNLTCEHGTFSGTADELGDKRWMVGLAGFEAATGAPVVVHMNVERAEGVESPALSGSVVVDTDGESYAAAFVAVKTTAPAPQAPTLAAPTMSARYHLPGD